MRLIHFCDECGAPRLGARTASNQFIDLRALGLPDTLDGVRLLPPVLQPAKASS